MRRAIVESIGAIIVSFLAAGFAHAGPCLGSGGSASYAGPLCGRFQVKLQLPEIPGSPET